MSLAFNDIEQWMKKSAEMGEFSVPESHWQNMKELLQPKKKRRLLIWWFLACLLLISLFSGLFFTTHFMKTNKPVKTVHQETKQPIWNIPNNRSIPKPTKSGINASSFILQKKEPPLDNKKVNIHLPNKKAITEKIINRSETTYSLSDTIENVSETNTQNITKKETADNVTNSKFIQGRIVKSDLNIAIGKQQKIDTSLTVNSNNNKLKRANKNKKASLSLGYFNGNIPVRTKGYSAELGYHFHIKKNIALHVSTGIMQFKTNEQQSYNEIKKISQVAGTTMFIVETSNKIFTPGSGLILTPSASIEYNIGKLKISAGITRGIIVNRKSFISTSIDTIKFFNTPLPANIAVSNYSFDDNNFNGKTFVQTNIGIGYSIQRNLFLTGNYSILNSFSKVAGIYEEQKKRNAFSLKMTVFF